MFKCLDCGHIFSEGELSHWKEKRGEFWGVECSEDMYGCPICHGDYDKAKRCEKCLEYFVEDDLDENYLCRKCREDEEEVETKTVWAVNLSNGSYLICENCIVETVCDAEHGDWKTALAQNIPNIKKGKQLEVVKVWQNFYGIWVRVNYNGRHYDIRPRHLKYIKAKK